MYDFVVIGGGIIGMSTAMQLQQAYPGRSVLVLEKESGPARHQTGHNSGVIHAGVYYKPGSLKARFCKEGNIATRQFCEQHDIKYDQCGKLLVATNAVELERMQALVGRCAENGIEIEVLDAEQLKAREPNISGVGAIFVPSTGIVSYTEISARMGELVQANGGEVRFNTEVQKLEEFADRVTVFTNEGRVQGRYLVACAGLHADRIVRMMGLEPDFKIIPFRGEYFLLDAQHNQIVNHLIYPIPDPELPFLGVHLTRMIDGTVTVGPNAVIAFAREGYGKFDISLKDCFEMFSYPGMLKVLMRNFKISLVELKNSLCKRGYLKLVQKYCPSLTLDDLKPYPAGIRAQAVAKDGSLVDDFLFFNTQRALAVCNAPSPAATSAIPIGGYIVEQVKGLVESAEADDAAQVVA
ncbi:L-2-hydroxyglutarate oxidase [Marinobacterium arenosum]|uniref:L-2-hydroxyglutarate oxidase n=1 Tax=Marinobacterium arenosum TaxID=2862496 RepID=UPI001C954CA4|nr:L-2-hydroxyglutarate oxidase [Marinobacterium arenosum]MBY4677432.1 L-2-hydroxyglutarate oxidase [Marinobacterium arenosum]